MRLSSGRRPPIYGELSRALMACSARCLYDGQFWTQKLRPFLLSEMSKALSFKPQVGQNTSFRASPAAINFTL